MKKAKITLWGNYHYEIILNGTESLYDVAMKISLEIHRKENKTKFTGTPRTFNYVYECLLRKSCLNFRINVEDTRNNEQELLKACNDLNSKSAWIKKQDDIGIEYYEHQDYRLGYTQSNTLIIDVDGTDMDNLKRVKLFYENILQCEFKVLGTKKGYWLFSDKKYTTLKDWIYDHCRILSPYLDRFNFEQYRADLLYLDTTNGRGFRRATPEIIKESKLYQTPTTLNFDIAFTFLSIKRERSTIRFTKKDKNDKIYEVDI